MADTPVGERQHRQDEHRGLPLATPSRSGYLSPSDKALLDALRVAGVASPASTQTTAATADVQALQVEVARITALAGGIADTSDHGLLTGLADDDHAQYHNNTRGDARYSVLAHLHAATYAPVAKGVTNGDTHDHAGGDGAQVDHGGLGGLTDDDHAQYLKADGTRTLTGDLLVTAGKKIDGVDIGAHDHSTLGLGSPVEHGNLNSLGNDHHTQYHTDARGDARYPLIAHSHAHNDVVNLTPREAVLGGTTPPVLTSTAGANFPYQTLNFIDGARGMAYWQIPVPTGYDGVSAIGVRLAFVLGASLNLQVRMDCNAGVPISDAPWDAAMLVTGVNGTRNYGVGTYTAGDLYTLNVNWTTGLPVANSFVIFGWGRDGAHVGDTCIDIVKLLGIRLAFPGTV